MRPVPDRCSSARSNSVIIPAAAKAVPRVGDAWRVDPERVLELRPDVVLVWPTGTPETTISRLRSLGLNIVEVPTQSLADVPRALRQVGRLAGTLPAAERTAKDFEARVAQQRAQYAQRPPLSVFIQIDDEPIYTVNGRHVISEIVVLCGGRNVFARFAATGTADFGGGGAGCRSAGDPEHGRHDRESARALAAVATHEGGAVGQRVQAVVGPGDAGVASVGARRRGDLLGARAGSLSPVRRRNRSRRTRFASLSALCRCATLRAPKSFGRHAASTSL